MCGGSCRPVERILCDRQPQWYGCHLCPPFPPDSQLHGGCKCILRQTRAWQVLSMEAGLTLSWPQTSSFGAISQTVARVSPTLIWLNDCYGEQRHPDENYRALQGNRVLSVVLQAVNKWSYCAARLDVLATILFLCAAPVPHRPLA